MRSLWGGFCGAEFVGSLRGGVCGAEIAGFAVRGMRGGVCGWSLRSGVCGAVFAGRCLRGGVCGAVFAVRCLRCGVCGAVFAGRCLRGGVCGAGIAGRELRGGVCGAGFAGRELRAEFVGRNLSGRVCGAARAPVSSHTGPKRLQVMPRMSQATTVVGPSGEERAGLAISHTDSESDSVVDALQRDLEGVSGPPVLAVNGDVGMSRSFHSARHVLGSRIAFSAEDCTSTVLDGDTQHVVAIPASGSAMDHRRVAHVVEQFDRSKRLRVCFGGSQATTCPAMDLAVRHMEGGVEVFPLSDGSDGSGAEANNAPHFEPRVGGAPNTIVDVVEESPNGPESDGSTTDTMLFEGASEAGEEEFSEVFIGRRRGGDAIATTGMSQAGIRESG